MPEDDRYIHGFCIKIDKIWTDMSIGACFSICPKLENGKREIYLIIDLFRRSITIGYMLIYDEEDGDVIWLRKKKHQKN